jgi:hypothetical protein
VSLVSRGAGHQHRIDYLLQVTASDGRVAIALGNNLALLGDPNFTVNRTGRLG